MINSKMKYCKNCKKNTTHTYAGRECRSFLLRLYNVAWKCDKCGCIHIQNTAYPERSTN